MLELTGLGSVLRALGLLYWGLAIVLLGLAIWKGKTKWRKLIWSGVVVALFGYLPAKTAIDNYQRNAFAKEAWAYFKKLCDEKSGEKIYKTFTGVKSVLVIKPLPPATDSDHFDQFWYGDPYSASANDDRGMYAATRLVLDRKHRNSNGIQRGLDFVEFPHGSGYTQIFRPESNNQLAAHKHVGEPVSKFGVSWEDISTPDDRRYWVAASRFRVIDLTDNSVVAERIGFLIEAGFGSKAGGRRPWLTSRGIGPNGRSCPDAHDATDQWFLTSVFQQVKE